MGNFNWPHINWDTWETSGRPIIEGKFVDSLRKNFLLQHQGKNWRVGCGGWTPTGK